MKTLREKQEQKEAKERLMRKVAETTPYDNINIAMVISCLKLLAEDWLERHKDD